MFSKIVVLCAALVAVNASGFLNYAVPSKTIVSTHYASPVVRHIAPVAVAPVLKTYVAPVAVAPVLKTYAAPVGYSRSYFKKYAPAPKLAVAHAVPLAYHSHAAHAYGAPVLSHVAPVAVSHGYSTSTVVKHAAPLPVVHAAPLAVGHVAYSSGLFGHRLGGVVYGGHKSIHY